MKNDQLQRCTIAVVDKLLLGQAGEFGESDAQHQAQRIGGVIRIGVRAFAGFGHDAVDGDQRLNLIGRRRFKAAAANAAFPESR